MLAVGARVPEWRAKALMPRDRAGNFQEISDENYLGRWLLLFWYPADFTFICPTEIIAFSDRQIEFNAINSQIIAISCDSSHSHLAWTKMSRAVGGLGEMNIPIISDHDKKMSRDFNVLLPSGQPLRACLLIDPKGVLRQMTLNDHPVGRNVDEMLRLVKAFQFTDEHGEVCPANWQPGGQTMAPDPHRSKLYFASAGATRVGGGDGLRKDEDDSEGPGATTHIRFQNLALIAPSSSSSSSTSSTTTFSFSRGVKNMLAGYQDLLTHRPLQTKAVTSCVISMLGEVLGSYIKQRRSQQPGGALLNWKRLGIFGIYGLAITGPLFHWWYRALDMFVARRGLPPRISIALKILLDRLLLTPPFLLATLGFLNYAQTLDAPSTVSAIRNTYAVALYTNWRVWTVAQGINFTYVPQQYRVLFGNLVALWWNIVLSTTVPAACD